MKRAWILLLLLVGCVDPTALRYVVDGDTLVLNNGSTIRLQGIDTPERDNLNYDKAAYELQIRLRGKQLRFEGSETDRYDRLVRYVFADGVNINLQMVEEGWAIAFPYTPSKYDEVIMEAQNKAREKRKGIWGVDERQYQRLSHLCQGYGCPEGTTAIASETGSVVYHCGCGTTTRITKAVCYESVLDAIADGLRETKRC